MDIDGFKFFYKRKNYSKELENFLFSEDLKL